MPSVNKQLIKMALAIHVELLSGTSGEPLFELPTSRWQQCAELAHQIRRARLRGFHLAANVVRKDLDYAVSSLLRELTCLQAQLQGAVVSHPTTRASDIYQDLLALAEEFEEFQCDCRARRLSVTTEPIVLNGIYLGPFEIRLQWTRPATGGAPAYRVIAMDPHPSESRDNVTHPHVMDEILCEGDGQHAVRAALANGRLLDFFTLIAGILGTYNPESPFVELSLWHGSSCSDCGSGLSEYESYSCHRCGDVVCSDCERLCAGCEEGCCSSCIGPCPGCDDSYCRRCLSPCHACNERFCSGCLNQERCPNCHEEDSPKETTASSTHLAVQPHGVG